MEIIPEPIRCWNCGAQIAVRDHDEIILKHKEFSATVIGKGNIRLQCRRCHTPNKYKFGDHEN